MDPIWSPSPERMQRAKLTRFMQLARERYGAPVGDYASLHRWSVEFPENFWSAVWDFCEVRAATRATQILVDGNRLPGARWFIDARFNYAENLLRRNDEAPALIFRDEHGQRRELSWRELRRKTARVADALKAAGVKPGDRVAGYLPNIPETVVAMLAANSVGAVWSCCPSDAAPTKVVDCLSRISPKILFASDGYRCAGRSIDTLSTVRALQAKVPGIERLVLIPHSSERPALAALDNAVSFADAGNAQAQLFSPTQLPFEHPAFIVYCAGPSGPFKCIVHSAGGALLQQLTEHSLHSDMGTDDRYLHCTSCGSTTWNALVSALATGTTVVLFDGDALQPDPRTLWRIAQEERVTVFGASSSFFSACEQAGVQPRHEFDLSALRTILVDEAPLPAAGYRYVYRDVKTDVQLAPVGGSRDVLAHYAAGCPILPIYEGEMQCLSLGMKTEVYDAAGQPLNGQCGELVCTEPFPAMPIGLWGDTDGSQFRSAYFARFPNVWCHGELGTITPRGGVIVRDRLPSPPAS